MIQIKKMPIQKLLKKKLLIVNLLSQIPTFYQHLIKKLLTQKLLIQKLLI